ncbi:MAG: hypoxanthine phosphoribosyltransferase [Flammeovirgaceae bacterium]|nr:hypoxanthine phosphoribosyltransferase [Flammeovirgaceae bacterium]
MKVADLNFKKFIPKSEINSVVKKLAGKINVDYKGKTPVFLSILNGSFMFTSDLIKFIDLDCKVSFVKVSSYSGTQTTGQVKTLIGLDESLFKQDVIIVEDIVDTGTTLQKILEELTALGVRSVEVISLLRKEIAREKKVNVKYVGFDIDSEFVLGYGLDYNGLGRNFADLYKKV